MIACQFFLIMIYKGIFGSASLKHCFCCFFILFYYRLSADLCEVIFFKVVLTHRGNHMIAEVILEIVGNLGVVLNPWIKYEKC